MPVLPIGLVVLWWVEGLILVPALQISVLLGLWADLVEAVLGACGVMAA